MSESQKELSQRSLLGFLHSPGEGFPPVQLRLLETGKRIDSAKAIDALVEANWKGSRFIFGVNTKLQFNPKAIQEAAKQIASLANQLDVSPMILTPYLADEQLRFLESQQVSGIDLCGNGVIVVPGRLLVYRTGNANRYPSSNPIRNIYRGASSLVARSFLLCDEYETSQDLLNEIESRGGEVTLSTVSKVCTSLEKELIIERKRQGRTTRLRLLQREKLLARLTENYAFPEVYRRFAGKVNLEAKALDATLQEWKNDDSKQIVRTGASSFSRYATMAREPIDRFYCNDLTALLKRLGESLRETDRFPNIEILETGDVTVYYDPREGIDASPVQAYLELASGDKRERETAEQIRRQLLDAKPSGNEIPLLLESDSPL